MKVISTDDLKAAYFGDLESEYESSDSSDEFDCEVSTGVDGPAASWWRNKIIGSRFLG